MKRRLQALHRSIRALVDELRWAAARRVIEGARYRPPLPEPALVADPPALGVDPTVESPESSARARPNKKREARSNRTSRSPAKLAADAAADAVASLINTIDETGARITETGRRLRATAGIAAPRPRGVAVVVIDMRGFSRLTSQLDDTPYVLGLIDEYLSAMTRIIEAHRGIVFQYTGDGLLALFLPELAELEPAALLERLVTKVAPELHEAFARLKARWRTQWSRQGRAGTDVGLGVGISYGRATVGLIGPSGKKYFGIIGEPVNMAAFLCSQARPGTVLVDKASFERAGAEPASGKVVRMKSEKLHQRIEALAYEAGASR